MSDLREEELASLRRENRLLRAIIDHVSDGVYAVDKEGYILFYNKAFEKIEGTEQVKMLGCKDSDIYPSETLPVNDYQRSAVLKGKKPLLDQFISYLSPAGKKADLLLNSYPYFENGEIVAVYEIGRDLSSAYELMQHLVYNFDRHHPKARNNGTRYSLHDIIGASPIMTKVIYQAKRIAQTKSIVTIIGETGVGKELFAQGIHNASPFANKPFVAINCAAIPDTLMEALMMGTVKGAYSGAIDAPGFFEQAEGGTLFLDEINSLSLHLQPKLLRLIQEKTVKRLGDNRDRPIKCRIICASNEDLFETIKKGQFRDDLFYRLTSQLLYVPPLRDHKEDIPLFLDRFITEMNTELSLNISRIDPAVIDLFSEYHWPGNIRELRHTIESAMTFAQSADTTLSLEHIPAILRSKISEQEPSTNQNIAPLIEQNPRLKDFLTVCEKMFIEAALAKSKGIPSTAAKNIGLSRQNFNYRLRKLGIRNNNTSDPSHT
jgi:arginine utilization regulatory protein